MSRVPMSVMEHNLRLRELAAEQEAQSQRLDAEMQMQERQLQAQRDIAELRQQSVSRAGGTGRGAAQQPLAESGIDRLRALVARGGQSPLVEINGVPQDVGPDLTPAIDPQMLVYAELLGIDPRLANIQAQQDTAERRLTSSSERDRVRNKERQFNTMYNRFERFANDTNLPIEERERITEQMLNDFSNQTQPSPFSYYDYLDENNDPAKKALKAREVTDAYMKGDASRLHELVDIDPKTGKVDLNDLKMIKELTFGSDDVEKERIKAMENLVGQASTVAENPTEENVFAFRALQGLHQQRFGAFPGQVPSYGRPGDFNVGRELAAMLGGPKQTSSAPVQPALQSRGQANQFVIKAGDAPNVIQEIVNDAKSQARASGKSIPIRDESGNIVGYANP